MSGRLWKIQQQSLILPFITLPQPAHLNLPESKNIKICSEDPLEVLPLEWPFSGPKYKGNGPNFGLYFVWAIISIMTILAVMAWLNTATNMVIIDVWYKRLALQYFAFRRSTGYYVSGPPFSPFFLFFFFSVVFFYHRRSALKLCFCVEKFKVFHLLRQNCHYS